MSLRKSPTLTPALLAAIRRNSKKSTGPRTTAGKARTRFNAFKHGRRTRLFREALLSRGIDPYSYNEELLWYELLLGPQDPRDRRLLERSVRDDWWRGEQLKEFFFPTSKVRMSMKTKSDEAGPFRISQSGTTQQRDLKAILSSLKRSEGRSRIRDNRTAEPINQGTVFEAGKRQT